MTESTFSRKGSVESLNSEYSFDTVQSEPERLPPTLKGALVWRGDELNTAQYLVQLSEGDIDAVKSAVAFFKRTGHSRSDITCSTFPLSSRLVQKLSAIGAQVHKGIGFMVVRGLDKALFNDEDSVIAFVGIACHVCPERATDAYANQTLSHIRDATRDMVPGWAHHIGLAGSKLPVAMEFHADRFAGDVLALHVRDTGSDCNGGDQYLASFWSIYNELLNVAPDVLETLASPDWPFEVKDRESNKPCLVFGPVIFFAEGRVISQLVRAPLLGSPRIPRSAGMPELSSAQLHALKIVEETAQRMSTKLDHKSGDIQFINNLAVLHARSAYGTGSSAGPSSRHLMRMFLRDPVLAWKKPREYADKFDDPFTTGRRQDIPVTDSDPWRKVSGNQSHG